MSNYPEGLKHLDYLDYAKQFYKAFGDLPKQPPPQSWPRYFMLCHAIELAIKAYLSARDATLNLTEQSIRHNFTKLLDEATPRGLSLSATTQEEIKL